jgi:hypothetical protein
MLAKNISTLLKYKSTALQMIIYEGEERGTFYRYSGDRPADGGIILLDGLGRKWKRDFDPVQGIRPEWWKGKPDGIVDNIYALNAARDYITDNDSFGGNERNERLHLQLSDGFYRTTEPFIIGGLPLSPYDALLYQYSHNWAPSYVGNEVSKVGRTLPISIKCTTRSFIFGDFAPSKLTPIVAIGASGWQHGGFSLQSTVISGLKVIGRTHMDMNWVGNKSNQVGLLMFGGNHISMDNCFFYGLQEGFISNTQYGLKMEQMNFGNCGRGFLSVGSHGTTAKMLFADHCDLGYEIASNAGNYSGINTEQCKKALITNRDNIFTGGYFEQLDNTSGPNDFQVQVGYPVGHHHHNDTFYGVEFNGVTVAARNQKHYLLEQGTTNVENVPGVRIKNRPVFGYNMYKNPKTVIDSEGVNWLPYTED